ncbi:MAG: arsenate reductase family protein [Chlorobi bacterium]|nr:arsenate reductase family protein [Chlorobiota bacterium]
MAIIQFFEKPGCRNNTRQKAMLELAGHSVETVNLLEHPWSEDELEDFLGTKPVTEWFNPAASSVKSGKTDPYTYGRKEVLREMARNPVLIKHPLMKIGNHRIQGFDMALLRTLVGLSALPGAEAVFNSMKMTDMDTCPHIATFRNH